MPRMQDTVPIGGSTFIMSEACECGSVEFKSRGCSSVFCVKCEKNFTDTERFYRANWRYEPVPANATNV